MIAGFGFLGIGHKRKMGHVGGTRPPHATSREKWRAAFCSALLTGPRFGTFIGVRWERATPMRAGRAAGIMAIVVLLAGPIAARAEVGPSFPCLRSDDPLAKLICADSAPSGSGTQLSAMPEGTPAVTANEVYLEEQGGIFFTTVRINAAIILRFVADSDAAYVQIRLDVFSTLVRAEAIVASGVIGNTGETPADESTEDEPRFARGEMKVGTGTSGNVIASVSTPLVDCFSSKAFCHGS